MNSPAGGDIPRQTRDRLIHGSTSRFVRFAHVVVFVVQTATMLLVLLTGCGRALQLLAELFQ